MIGIIARRWSSSYGRHFLETPFCLFYFHFIMQSKLSKTVQIFKTVQNCPRSHRALGWVRCTSGNPELHGGQRRNLHYARVSSAANKLARNYVFSGKLVCEMPRRAISMPSGDLDSFGLGLNIFEILKITQNPQLWWFPQSEPRQLRENCLERLGARAWSTEQCCRRYRPPLESYRKKYRTSQAIAFFIFTRTSLAGLGATVGEQYPAGRVTF